MVDLGLQKIKTSTRTQLSTESIARRFQSSGFGCQNGDSVYLRTRIWIDREEDGNLDKQSFFQKFRHVVRTQQSEHR